MNHVAAFITGHSVRGCTGLSREQRAFQENSAVPGEKWLRHNFPWHETFPFPDAAPLLTASWNNGWCFLSSRRPLFEEIHREAVVERFAALDAVILLAGSCGLELLNNLHLPGQTLDRIHVFAYGPVSRRRPATASCLVVQGERDWISRGFHRRADRRYPCSHLGYLRSPETLRHFDEFYRGIARDSRG